MLDQATEAIGKGDMAGARVACELVNSSRIETKIQSKKNESQYCFYI